MDFSIAKDRLVLVVICSALMLLLLFGAGVAAGFLLAGHGPSTKDVPESEALQKESTKVKKPKTGAKSTKDSSPAAAASPPAATQATGAQVSSAQAASAQAASAQGGSAPASSPASSAAASPPKMEELLTIEAASFREQREASNLAALLRRDGYRPVFTGQDSSSSDRPYYVRLGPYRTWEQASQIATELERSYDLRTIVRPVRTAATPS